MPILLYRLMQFKNIFGGYLNTFKQQQMLNGTGFAFRMTGGMVKDDILDTIGDHPYISSAIAGVATYAIITKAIQAASDKWNLSYDSAMKNTSEGVSKLSETKSEIEKINSETEKYKSTLKSIGENYNLKFDDKDSISSMIDQLEAYKRNDNGSITLVDQAEIDKIKTANSELEATSKLKQNQAKAQQKSAAKDARDMLNRGKQSFAQQTETKAPGYNKGTPAWAVGNTNLPTQIKDDVSLIRQYKSEVTSLEKKQGNVKYNSKKWKNYQKDINTYNDLITDLYDDIDSRQEDLSTALAAVSENGAGEKALKGYENEFKELKSAANAYANVDLTESQSALAELNDYFDGSVSKNAIKQQLEDAAKSGKGLTQTLHEMGLNLKDLGNDVNGIYLAEYFNEVAKEAGKAKVTVSDYTASVSDIKDATESANQDTDWSTVSSAWKSAKELQAKGKTGTDDFQTMAKFLNPKRTMELVEQAKANGTYIGDAYEQAINEAKGTANRWLGDDEEKSMVNFIKDMKNAGMWEAKLDSKGLWDIQTGFESTAQAAEKLGVSTNLVETMLKGLEAYGYDFSNVMFSGEGLQEYETALKGIQDIYNSMDSDSKGRKRLEKLLKGDKDENGNHIDGTGFEDQYEQYQEDMSKLSKDQIIKIKFEYDLAEIQQQIDQLKATAEAGGDSQTWAELNATEKAYRTKSESRDGNGITNVQEYSAASDAIDNLNKKLVGATEEQKTKIQEQVNGILEAQNKMNDTFADSGLSWDDFINTDAYKLALGEITDATNTSLQNVADLLGIDVSDLQVKVDADTSEAEGKIQELSGKTIYMSTDADTSQIENAIEKASAGDTIMFTADIGGVDTAIAAIKNEDGTISYYANVDNVTHEVEVVKDEDGQVHYTIGDAPDQAPDIPGFANYNMGRYPTTAPTIWGTVNYKLGSVAKPSGAAISGGASIAASVLGKFNGTANLHGTAKAHGDWAVKKSETALVGELGRETIVRGGKYFTVGDNGAEFTKVRKGDVILNHVQTKELFKNGHVTSGGGRAKVVGESPVSGSAHVAGTAYRLGANGAHGTTGTKKKSSSKSSSGKSSASNNSSSNTSKAEENLTDWIKVLLERTSRITGLAVDAIDRAIGLINKQVKAADSISKVQNEIRVNQQAAQKYLDYANQVGLSEAYKNKVKNGELNIENISDENTRDKVSKYQEYYEAYLDATDKVLDLEDKLTELAEKRLSIIEDEYDAIVDVNDALKDLSESKMDFNDSYGVARDNSDNYDSINKAIAAQEDTYTQLTTKLAEYQKEVESQLNSGLMKKGSEQYYDAMKNINDFTAKMYDAQKELLEWKDKLTQIKLDTIQGVIDIFERRVSKLDKYASLLDARDESVPEQVYQEQMDGNNSQILKMYEKRAELLKQQSVYDVNSEEYEKYAEDIQKIDESILDLQKDNEDLKNSIYDLRIKPLEDAIEKYSDLEDELKNFRDILNEDAFLDKKGGITDEGLAQIALLQQSIGNAKQKISDYTTGLQKIKELYD